MVSGTPSPAIPADAADDPAAPVPLRETPPAAANPPVSGGPEVTPDAAPEAAAPATTDPPATTNAPVAPSTGSADPVAALIGGALAKAAQDAAPAPAAEDDGTVGSGDPGVPAAPAPVEQKKEDEKKEDEKKEETKEEEKKEDVVKAEEPSYQKTVNLREEMDSVTSQGIYQDYLMFCMQGDTVNAPMGVQITIERDQSEFTRLTQLGDILGLNQMEVGAVHKGLADKAFRAQAEQMLADGKGLTAERSEKLKEIQTSLSLPEPDAQRIIKGITSKKMLSEMQAQIAMGTLSIADVRKMKEEGVEIDNVITPDKRMQLFRKNAESRLTDGSGAADIEALSETLPADLGIEPEKAKSELLKIANDKKRSTMVAAVAELRQKKVSDVVKSAKNLVACHGVAPESKLEWGVKEELQDIYSVFANEGAGEEEQKNLQDALGLDDETCDGLREIVKAGKFQLKQDVADEALF